MTLPLAIVAGANQRGHWSVAHRKAQSERGAMIVVPLGCVPPPCTVTLTRLSPRRMDDDNLANAFKHVRDGIADRLGVNDGNKLVTWRYAQEPAKEQGIRIVIEPA